MPTSADLVGRFESALGSLSITFEPIVAAGDGDVIGYAALAQAQEPGLGGPLSLAAAADHLGRQTCLGQVVRSRVADALDLVPTGALVFVSMHPAELHGRAIFSSKSPLFAARRRVVFELSELTPLPDERLERDRLTDLRDQGYRLAIRDFGSGFAEVRTLVELQPELVKAHRALTTGLPRTRRARVLSALSALCRQAGALLVGEGIETEEHREIAAAAGCDLLQGALFEADAPALMPLALAS